MSKELSPKFTESTQILKSKSVMKCSSVNSFLTLHKLSLPILAEFIYINQKYFFESNRILKSNIKLVLFREMYCKEIFMKVTVINEF